MKELFLKATIDNLNQVLDFVEGELISHGCSTKLITTINISVEELFVNIASYAYAPDVGDCLLSINFVDDYAIISLKDSGIEFNPLLKEDPDIYASAENRDIGGLGIYMVKKYMDNCYYERKDGFNIITIKKKIN